MANFGRMAICIAGFVSALTAPSLADVIVYDDASLWNAAVSNPSTVTFDNDKFYPPLPIPFTENGATFTIDNHGGLAANVSGVYGPSYGSGYLAWTLMPLCEPATACGPPPNPTVTVTLSSEVNAISFEFSELREQTEDFVITVDGETFTRPSGPDPMFFGITDSGSFSSFTITANDGDYYSMYPTIAEVSYSGTLTSVPEPGDLTIFLVGIGAVVVMRKKRGGKRLIAGVVC